MARIEIVNDGTVRECAEGANLLAELLRAGACLLYTSRTLRIKISSMIVRSFRILR